MGGDHQMVVARFNTDGNARHQLRHRRPGVGQRGGGGGTEETSRSIVVQADGKIVIGGAVDKK